MVLLVTSMLLAQLLPAPQAPSPTISWADIEAAKSLLAQARGELQPQQFEVLERELVQAEGAFQRFSTLARTGGQAAEVARGAEALAGAQRASRLAEGLGTLSRVGPMLVTLALLWPSSTATEAQERPPWLVAKWDLEASLQRVATQSQKLAKEMEAARKQPQRAPVPGPVVEAASGRERCGSCLCFYRGAGPLPKEPQPTRALCRKACEQDKVRPAHGMKCAGDKAVEWWN